MVGKFGAQTISLLLSFVLTRLLSPEEFGVAGIAMVMIFVSSIFLDMGFAKALIQAKTTSRPEYASVFSLNLILGIFFTCLCFFLATPIAFFYNLPELEPVMRVLSFLFLVNAVSLVPVAILTREMKFKKLALAGLISAVISGTISIIMALKGYGVWSLVTQYMVSTTLAAILTFCFTKWKPVLLLSKKTLQPLWHYGSRMFYSSIFNIIVTRLDVFIIGRLFNANLLGHYTRSQSIDSAIRQFSTGSLISVFFPAVARLQDEKKKLAELYIRFLHIVAFFSAGISGLLYLISPDVFRIIFTAKWDTAAIYFQIMCVAGFAWPVSALMVTLISGTGNSKAYFRLELIKVAIQLPVYLFGFLAGITTFLWIFAGIRVISLCLNAYFASREVTVYTSRQLGITFVYLLFGAAATAGSIFIADLYSAFSAFGRIICSILVYTLLYLGLHLIFDTKMKTEMFLLLQKLVKKKN